jgi:hypothetical protein
MRVVRWGWALAGATIVLGLTVQAGAAQADVSPGGELFNRLDAAIVASVEERHQHAFLVQVAHARDAALPPNPCKAPNFGPLGAFGHHVDAQEGKQVSEAGAAQIRSLIGVIRQLPPNPCVEG